MKVVLPPNDDGDRDENAQDDQKSIATGQSGHPKDVVNPHDTVGDDNGLLQLKNHGSADRMALFFQEA